MKSKLKILMLKPLYLLFLLFGFLNGSCMYAPPPEITGDIKGRITDARNSKPLEFSIIHLEINTIMSGIDGIYSFRNLDPKTYTILVEKTGYKSQSKTVTVEVGNTISADFQLDTIK